MQHVGVGQHDVGALADLRARLARRVAVVDRRAHALGQAERGQRPRLVLGERLGRIEVERPRARVLAEHVQRGQVEAHGLARGGARGDDRRAVRGGVDGLGLMGVELLDAQRARSARAPRGAARAGARRALPGRVLRGPRARAGRRPARRRAGRSTARSGGLWPRVAIVEAMPPQPPAGQRIRATTGRKHGSSTTRTTRPGGSRPSARSAD